MTEREIDRIEGDGLRGTQTFHYTDGTKETKPWPAPCYTTKDSGARQHFDSGMQRDTQDGKARFDLLVPEGVPYKAQLLTRWAELMERGARKYDARNWEKANSEDEISRARSSAFRHFMQWFCGEDDEDHAAAAMFNLLVVETTKHKLEGI